MDMVNKNTYYNEDVAEGDARKTFLGLRASAAIEMMVLITLLWVIDKLVCDGSGFYSYQLPANPYLWIVLFLTLQYGSLTGIVTALLAIVAFFLNNSLLSLADLGRVEVALYPVFWIILAGFLGMIRDRHMRERKRFQSKLTDSLARERVTAEAYEEVRGRKQRLEERVAGEMRSALTVYQAAKSLENMSPAHLMQSLENMLRDLLGAETFSLFLMEGNVLEASITAGWHGAYTSLPRRYTSSSAVYQHVVGNRELLTIANADHEQLLAGEGLMAAPVVTPTGEVLGMIKIEALPFSRFGIQTVETLRLVAEWAAAALSNARNYEAALGMAIEDPRNKLLTSNYFERFTAYITALGKRAKFPVSLVGVGISMPDNLPQAEEVIIGRIVSDAVKSCLRNVDLAFDYAQGGSQYSIILPNTDRQGAEIVRDKISAKLDEKLRMQGLRHPFTTTVQELAA